jgi:hypothetical protein
VFFAIVVFNPALVHEPPAVAALAGVVTPKIKKPVIKTADNFFFNLAPSFNLFLYLT